MSVATPDTTVVTAGAPAGATGTSPESGAGTGTTGTAPALPEWLEALPDDLKADKSLHDVKDVPALAKRFVDTKKLVGNSIRLPGPEAKPEEWDAIHARLGWPKDPAGYQVQRPALPQGQTWDEAEVQSALESAHALRLTPTQVQAIFAREAQARTEAHAALVKATAETTAALRQTWGHEYDARLAAVNRRLASAPPEVAAVINAEGLGASRWFVELMDQVAQATREDRAPTVEGGGPASTLDAAKARIQEIEQTPELRAKLFAGDVALKTERQRLYDLVHGTTPRDGEARVLG